MLLAQRGAIAITGNEQLNNALGGIGEGLNNVLNGMFESIHMMIIHANDNNRLGDIVILFFKQMAQFITLFIEITAKSGLKLSGLSLRLFGVLLQLVWGMFKFVCINIVSPLLGMLLPSVAQTVGIIMIQITTSITSSIVAPILDLKWTRVITEAPTGRGNNAVNELLRLDEAARFTGNSEYNNSPIYRKGAPTRRNNKTKGYKGGGRKKTRKRRKNKK